jgi:hypothetical protein
MISMNLKAQVTPITAVLIIVIAIGITTAGLSWGIPLIEKQQDKSKSERIAKAFDQDNSNSLPSMVESIANARKGEDTFSLDADGLWTMDEVADPDWIQFEFFSKVSTDIAPDGWISLTPGTGATCPPTNGILGLDRASVVCGNAERVHDGYTIKYRVYFRGLDEMDTGRVYKIDLNQTGLASSTTKSIRISFGEEIETEDLITTEIKISL